MKIMVVNNNVMYENAQGLFIYKETGKFFVDIMMQGNEVTVFQFRMPFVDNDFLADFNLYDKGLKIKAVRRRKSKLWAYVKAFFIGFNTVRKSDFVYLFYPGQICKLLALFSIILGKPYGFYVRGEQGIMSKSSKYLYKKAKVVLTISPKFTQTIKDLGAHAQTIRPMMDVSEKDIVSNRRYQNKEHYKLLYVGRLESPKGVYDLYDAIKQTVNQGMNIFTLDFVGDGVDAANLKKLTQEGNVSSKVNFHGTITDRVKLSEFYKSADLFIFPSHHEGFPRVLYEAMIFGTPIITTFVGSISYLMKDQANCWEIKPKQPELLAQKIQLFLKNYAENAKIALKGTSTIIEYLEDKKDPHAIKLLKSIK